MMIDEGKIVSHYGIHHDEGGVAFLEQGRGSTNAVGLKKRSGLTVRLQSGKKHCNHMIPLSAPVPADYHWEYFLSLQDDPLMRAMLPIPKVDGGTYFLSSEPNLDQILLLLSKMSSPIYNPVVPFWTLSPQAIMEELQQTNVQPFVVVGCEVKNSQAISQIANAAVYQPRKIVFVGSDDVAVPPNVKRLQTSLTRAPHSLSDLTFLPWEQIGATVVRKFMRREWK